MAEFLSRFPGDPGPFAWHWLCEDLSPILQSKSPSSQAKAELSWGESYLGPPKRGKKERPGVSMARNKNRSLNPIFGVVTPFFKGHGDSRETHPSLSVFCAATARPEEVRWIELSDDSLRII